MELEIKDIDICPLCGKRAKSLILPFPVNNNFLKLNVQCTNLDCPLIVEDFTSSDYPIRIIGLLNELIEKWNNLKTLKNREK